MKMGMAALLLPLLIAEDFWTKFQGPYQAGDVEGMKKAVASDPQGAIEAYTVRVEKFAVEMDDETGKQVDAMRAAWTAAFNNNFFEHQYRYLSLLDSSSRKKRKELIADWQKMRNLFEGTRGTSKEENWAQLEKALPVLVESLEAVGELYYASWATYNLAQTFDPSNRPKGSNARTALEHYRRFLENRDRLDLKDGFYNTVKGIAERYEKIYRPAAPGEGGADGGSVPFKLGTAWFAVPLVPASAESAPEGERIGYDDDELYVTWPKIQIEAMKPAQFANLPGKVQLIREGAARFSFDQDGDGKGDLKLKASGRPELVELSWTLGPTAVKYALWITSGTARDMVQRVETSGAPTNELATFYYRSATVRTADVLGLPFRMFDQNADGRFNYEVVGRTVDGMDPKSPLPVIDSWVIGKGKRAGPASAYAQLNDKWYRVEFDSKMLGQELRLREVEGNEGTLALEYKGPPSLKPSFLIVKAIGIYNGAFFDLAGSPKGIKVPAGAYEILYGVIRSGKGERTQKAVITKGQSKAAIVEAGKSATIKIGEPFSLDFEWSLSGNKLTVPGASVVVVGSSGERYEMIWDEVPTPEIQVRAAGKPFGRPVETRRAVISDLNQAANWGILWHPIDATFDVSKPSDKFEVRLSEKHKWFGKLESAWK